MKKFKLYSLALLALAGLSSCEEENNDTLTGNNNTGGLITVNDALVGYVVGNGVDTEYDASFTVFQGAVKTTQVDVYKVFTSATLGTSNEVLLETFTIPTTPQNQTIDFSVTYNELIAGLTVGGGSLPTSDALLNIGDNWVLKYVSKTSVGTTNTNLSTTKVSVGTRFAGTYRVVEGEYWRINIQNTSINQPGAGWVGELRTIESVNATTYKFLDYVGPFGAVTNTHYFTIDAMDVVRTPTTYLSNVQLFNGQPATNCEETPGDILNACGWPGLQNTVVRDDVTGKDRIYRTYGYLTAGSGPRELYEVLEKVVE